jgi:hypothetical protein
LAPTLVELQLAVVRRALPKSSGPRPGRTASGLPALSLQVG